MAQFSATMSSFTGDCSLVFPPHFTAAVMSWFNVRRYCSLCILFAADQVYGSYAWPTYSTRTSCCSCCRSSRATIASVSPRCCRSYSLSGRSALASTSWSVTRPPRPPTSSSLKITDRYFRRASPCLWNQLPLSLRRPHSGTSSSTSDSPATSPITSSSSVSPLCSSMISSLFHSRLKTYLFHKFYPHSFTSSSRTAFTDSCLQRFYWANRFLFICHVLDKAGHLVSYWAHVNISYRIICLSCVICWVVQTKSAAHCKRCLQFIQTEISSVSVSFSFHHRLKYLLWQLILVTGTVLAFDDWKWRENGSF